MKRIVLFAVLAASATAVFALPAAPIEGAAATLTIDKSHQWSTDWKVFQRDAQDEATIPVRVTYTADEPVRLQAQVTDGGSFKFPNPLHEIQAATAAVKSHLPDTTVSGIILFGRDSTFPKGKPDGVMHISELTKLPLPAAGAVVPETVRRAWDRLLELKSAL